MKKQSALFVVALTGVWGAGICRAAHPKPPAPPASPAPATSSSASTADDQDTLDFADRSHSPASRVGAGSRGSSSGPAVYLLVSSRTGLTLSPRPTLFWYLARDTEADVDLVVSEPGETTPLFSHRFTGGQKSGLHRFSFNNDAKELKVAVQYKVTVTVWQDPDDPSRNPFSSGFVQRVERPATLAADADPTPADFCREGLWYDSLDALSRRIEQEPANPHLRNQRRSLLLQEHVFLNFAPDARWHDIPGVAAAQRLATSQEEQLVKTLSNLDELEMKGK